MQVKYLEDLGVKPSEKVENLNEEEVKAENEKAPQVEEIKESKKDEYDYELGCARLDKLKELIG